jgi:hypothetical protein
MDVRDPTTSKVGAACLECGSVARPHGEVSPEVRARPRQDSRGVGEGLRRTQGDTADSTVGTTPVGHQRAQNAAERPNGGADFLRLGIA